MMVSNPPRMSSSTRSGGLLILVISAFGLAAGACTGRSNAVYSRFDSGAPVIIIPTTDGRVVDGPMLPTVPTCTDHLANGSETDIDCGGDGACARCANGKVCLVGGDCTAGVCTSGVCQAPACANQIIDGQETDVDCGGMQCGPCDQGQHCQVMNDCASRTCTTGTCETPSCTDHMMNGSETDIDCGGAQCPACPPQAGCAIDRDCIAGICTSGTCAVATCMDGVKNQNETAIDCGGICGTCADGKACGQGQDCDSGVCPAGVCLAVSCTDAIKNGPESDVDCGGSCPTMCANGKMCGQNTDCAGGVCTTGLCQSATCADMIKDGMETDTDCGGPNCGPCLEGKACVVAADCQSQVCPAGKTCAAPSCSDMIKNGTESDVNCGGSCPGCIDGKKCSAGGDCASLVCTAGTGTCAVPSCSDAVKNGFEADRDCGGPASGCLKCAPGKICGVGPDCDSGNCMGGLCQAPSCTDGIQNGTETGQDCGGGGCPACADGKRCVRGSDCVSGVCPTATSTCAVPTCADLVKNGTETDADCGGSCAPAKRCTDTKGCATGGDCLDGVCGPGKTCLAPSCADLVKNGSETDIDCGGSCAPINRCADGQGCSILGTNCVNSVCTTGVCQMSSCGDMTKNGTETDVDCGGLSCGKCADTKICLVAADCLSGVCPAATHLCAVPSCMDAVKNGTETDLNCGGTMCPKCADGSACVAGTDCGSGVCSAANVCAVPTCGDLVKNGTETAIDCGGSCASMMKRCANNLACLVAGDCASGVCPAATHLCAAPTCSDAVLNGSETDLDCGGSCAPAKRCANNLMCVVAGDCVSASCVSLKCSAAGCQNCWKVQYRNRGPTIANQTLLSLNIVSIGTTSVPLSQLKMRYWFTADNGGTPVAPQNCDFVDATAGGSCSNVTMQMVSIPARPNANTYWEVGINSGTLAPGGNAGEIQIRFHVGNSFDNQVHTNDYSWSSTQTTLLDWNKVTLYNNGVLVWGIEP